MEGKGTSARFMKGLVAEGCWICVDILAVEAFLTGRKETDALELIERYRSCSFHFHCLLFLSLILLNSHSI